MTQPFTVSPDVLVLRRAILDWRDEQTAAAQDHFHSKLPDLFIAIDDELEAKSLRELITEAKSINEKQVQPIFEKWLEQETTCIQKNAQSALQKIVDQYIIDFKNSQQSFSEADIIDVQSGLLKTVGATSTGIAAIPIFTSLSTVSAGGFLGFVGMTAISWPIALAGFVVAGGLLALGGHQAITLKKKAVAKYRNEIQKFIIEVIFGSAKNNRSVMQYLQESIENTASTILQEISV